MAGEEGCNIFTCRNDRIVWGIQVVTWFWGIALYVQAVSIINEFNLVSLLLCKKIQIVTAVRESVLLKVPLKAVSGLPV